MKTWTTSLAARQYACNALPCLGSCFVHFFLLLFLVWAKWKCLSVRSKYLMAIWRVAAIELAAASVLATAAAVAVSVCSLFAVSLKCTQFFSWHLGSTCNNSAPELTSSLATSARVFVVCFVYIFGRAMQFFSWALFVFLCYLFCIRFPLPSFFSCLPFGMPCHISIFHIRVSSLSLTRLAIAGIAAEDCNCNWI